MALMDEEDLYGEEEDEFQTAIAEAFPGEEWGPDRLAALKEAIRICAREDRGKEEEPADDGGEDKGKSLLAIAFGSPKKKR